MSFADFICQWEPENLAESLKCGALRLYLRNHRATSSLQGRRHGSSIPNLKETALPGVGFVVLDTSVEVCDAAEASDHAHFLHSSHTSEDGLVVNIRIVTSGTIASPACRSRCCPEEVSKGRKFFDHLLSTNANCVGQSSYIFAWSPPEPVYLSSALVQGVVKATRIEIPRFLHVRRTVMCHDFLTEFILQSQNERPVFCV